MAKKKQKLRPVAVAPVSEIIEQCVIYVQQLAAYDAGFEVDHTGDADYAGAGGQMKKARRALFKLICLSPHKKPGAPPVSSLELHAKAGVLAVLYGLRKGEQPDKDEQAYIRSFAGEVSDFIVAHAHHPVAL